LSAIFTARNHRLLAFLLPKAAKGSKNALTPDKTLMTLYLNRLLKLKKVTKVTVFSQHRFAPFLIYNWLRRTLFLNILLVISPSFHQTCSR
jgi:hypothetical protein